MPHYFFHLHSSDGRNIDDREGVVLPDNEAAQVYAVQVIAELKLEDGDNFLGWSMEVISGNQLVARLPFFKAH